MMLRNLMSLLEILMPLVAMIAIFGLLCKILMNIYNKIYAHNFYYGFDYVDSIEWTIIIVITIFFMPATSRTISITLLALAIVNNICFFLFAEKQINIKMTVNLIKYCWLFQRVYFAVQ